MTTSYDPIPTDSGFSGHTFWNYSFREHWFRSLSRCIQWSWSTFCCLHACVVSHLGSNPCILDSGATNNMTPHKHLLHNLTLLTTPFLITLPNRYKVKVISTRSLHLRPDMVIYNVLLVPSFCFNMICLIRFLLNTLFSILYVQWLDNKDFLSLIVLFTLLFLFNLYTLTYRIHIILVPNGFTYFLTLIDDFSIVTWIYLLSCKSNALSVFKDFLAMVQVHFKSTIQSFGYGNAYELGTSSKVQQLFSASLSSDNNS